LKAAHDSPILKVRRYARKALLTAIRMLSDRVTAHEWEALASELLDIALDPWDYDYESTLRALEAVAHKSAAAKGRIREQLFKSRRIDTNLSAYTVAFGAEVNRDSFAAMVNKVADVLVKQVTTEAHVCVGSAGNGEVPPLVR
jgi:hypothetical protein